MGVEEGGEVGVEVGVEVDDLGDVAVELLDQSHVLRHVVWDSGLVVLVHLLDQAPVAVQHALHLPEALVEAPPRLRIAAVLRGRAFPQAPALLHARKTMVSLSLYRGGSL